MKKNKSCHLSWLRALGVTTMLLLNTLVRAGNEMENPAYWMITPSGTNTVKIQMPVYDEDGLDGWVDKGYLYVTPEGRLLL